MSYQELNYFNKKLNVQEAMCLLEDKVNELIEVNNAEHADHLDMMERFKEIDEFIAYLQGVGLEKEVRKVMDVFVLDGTFEKLINEKVLNDINDKVDSFILTTDAKLAGKRDKSVLLTQSDLSTSSEAHKLTMNHLSQEVKNAMTGTAPVSPNISDGQVTSEKLANNGVSAYKLSPVIEKAFGDSFEVSSNLQFLTTGGVFTSHSSTKYLSNELPFEAGWVLTVSAVYNSLQRIVAFLDENKAKITVYPAEAPTSNQRYEAKLIAPTGTKYVRICHFDNLGTSDYSFIVSKTNGGELINNSVSIEKIDSDFTSMLYSSVQTAVENKYLLSNGNFAELVSTQFTTAEIDVVEQQRFFVKLSYIQKSRAYAFYDASSKLISVFPTETGDLAEATFTKEVIVPKGAVKMRLCNYKYSYFIRKAPLMEIEPTAPIVDNQTIEYTMLANKILCIGDSLTQGAYYSPEFNGASIKENYPYYLQKLTDCTVTNAGKSGATASSWNSQVYPNVNFAEHDQFILWLGTNGGLTDTLDVDVVGTDPEQFANTQTGHYCKIIRRIQLQRPDANIYLVKVFASSGDKTVTNTTIDKIATKYGLPVINADDGSLYPNSTLHPFGNAVHFGKVGNLNVANKFKEAMNEYFKMNPSAIEKVYIK